MPARLGVVRAGGFLRNGDAVRPVFDSQLGAASSQPIQKFR